MKIIADSYESISASLALASCLPSDPTWSAAPDFLKLILDHSLDAKPEVIVECSSGVTTLVLARACQLNGVGHVYSLENGEEYVRATRGQLKDHGLEKYADVIHAPFQAVESGGRSFDWYQVSDLPVEDIGMLVIDGPPGFIQKHSRYPALPVLYDRLADYCRIFLDDAGREDEREVVSLWLREYKDLEHDYIGNERGCSILHKGP